MNKFRSVSRRSLLRSSTIAGTGLAAASALPLRGFAQTTIVSEASRIQVPYGAQVGDLRPGSAILWSKADRPARMMVSWSTTESMTNTFGRPAINVLSDTDYTGKAELVGLPADQKIFYRIDFVDLGDHSSMSQPVVGSFVTPPSTRRNVKFTWSGDTAGQGWGINPDFGGMKIYETMRQGQPDFFIHSGDTIYADGPMEAEKEMPNGEIWKNVMTEAKSRVAETLQDFRGNYAYNLMDENVRRFNAEVPMFAQWDDHEVVNNWYPGEVLEDERYKESSVDLLAARGRRAFLEYMPVRQSAYERDRLYQHFAYGPMLEIFRIDMRSYRGPNTANRQEAANDETIFLGEQQLRWLKQSLLESNATWKVIASDMPIGLMVRDGDTNFENLANGDGAALGRELEIAELLRFIRDNDIKNTVWLTADVHYTAAHYYDPSEAQFQEFAPFWEFVSGPLNAGTFGPNDLDNTFGPQVMYVKAPEEGEVNLPPSYGLQFFGEVEINGETEMMTVHLKDIDGNTLFTQELEPQA